MLENKKVPHQGHPRKKRLLKRVQFVAFFNGAEVVRGPGCTIFRVLNQESHARLGITFKAKGTSVERNRVRRVVRESFRKISSKLGSYDFNVLIPARQKLSYPYPRRLADFLKEGFFRFESNR